MDAALEDFTAYRQADVRWHIGLAEAAGQPAPVAAMTEAQGQMSDLIPTSPTRRSCSPGRNQQHAQMLAAVRKRDGDRAMRIMAEHLKGTEHVLAGLPRSSRLDIRALDFRPHPIRRFARK